MFEVNMKRARRGRGRGGEKNMTEYASPKEEKKGEKSQSGVTIEMKVYK